MEVPDRLRDPEVATRSAAGPVVALLTESFGESVSVDLFEGFLVSVADALATPGQRLVAGSLAKNGPAVITATFGTAAPIRVPIERAETTGAFDRAVVAALVAEADRLGRPARLPDLLGTIADAARGRLVDLLGEPLELRDLTVARDTVPGIGVADPTAALGTADPRVAYSGAAWRDRMLGVVLAGRLRLPDLATIAHNANLPTTADGLRELDVRVFIALRDLAVARASGEPLALPEHPDADVAAARAALIADLDAALDDVALPGPTSDAYVLTALLAPEQVRPQPGTPPEWDAWLWLD